MSYPAMNQDIILGILSYCPVSAIEKFRFLNKDYYKRMSESWFINLNLLRTNPVFGVFIQYKGPLSTYYSTYYVLTSKNIHHRSKVSLEFLPVEKVKIEACDPSHGILLCVDPKCYGRTTYIVCKPTTKQYHTIPNPETGCLRTIVTGLVVIGANPFRYKIVKLSQQNKITFSENDNCYTLICEVFDSDLFTWKRLDDDVKLPEGEFLRISSVPVLINGFLHWLTTSNKNVFRFCMKTETWSLHPLPNDLTRTSPLVLAKYKDKLGIILWKQKSRENLKGIWVLDSSFGKTWVNVKEEKSIVEEDKLVKPVWLLPETNVAVVMCGFDWVGLYDMKTNSMKSERYKISLPFTVDYNSSSVDYFPFYSDYERLNLNEGQTVVRQSRVCQDNW
ncbi:PREDICTED: F-box protein At5g49610-like [Camelina sativa]|uniref:F-box protein At5g49610-like n=1 Tax=Camelina sativa TaxID=90675 RepID=A0ABM0Y8E8_CAMSA|nr:PREDICTED: F-box protein At5g49610-like [Camelina sativa]